MAVARDMLSPRQASSRRSRSDGRRMGVGWARRIGSAKVLAQRSRTCYCCKRQSHGAMDWITDRLPTEADADSAWDVVIRLDHDQWAKTKWYNVFESTPWIALNPNPADAVNFLNDVAAAVEAGKRRRIVSITRTVVESGLHAIDAVADDGTAWWMIAGVTDGWTQLPALPDRE